MIAEGIPTLFPNSDFGETGALGAKALKDTLAPTAAAKTHKNEREHLIFEKRWGREFRRF